MLDGRPNVVDRRREPEAVVTAVKRGDAGQAVHFVRNVLVFMPEANIVLHDLGLSYYEVGANMLESDIERLTVEVLRFHF